MKYLALGLATLACSRPSSPKAELSPPPVAAQPLSSATSVASRDFSDVRQLVVSVAATWDSTTARVYRLERRAPSGFELVGPPLEAALGRAGLGFGRGLNPPSTRQPQKREGDGRAPAGVYRFGTAFGRSAPAELAWPFLATTPALRCIDDPKHPSYGELVDTERTKVPPFRSAESMQPTSGAYDLGLVVEHNLAPAEPGMGSCIFLHLTRTTSNPTSGCTSMLDRDLTALLRWLDPEGEPLFVQLPVEELGFADEVLGLAEGTLRSAIAR